MCLSHQDTVTYYQSNFQLMQEYKWSLSEIENMLPWEREVYIVMLNEYIKEENERIKQWQANH